MRGRTIQRLQAFVIASGALALARCGLDPAIIDALLENVRFDCPNGSEGVGPPQGYGLLGDLCALPRAAGSRWPSALRTGFAVSALELHRLAGGAPSDAARFSWTTPSTARVVTCALLGCPPVVSPEDERCDGRVCTSHWQNSDGAPIRRVIVNYARCAILHREFEPPVGEFDLNVVLPTEQSSMTPTLYTGLYVACWAYDDTSLIAASEVLRLSPADVGPSLRSPLEAPCAPLRPTENCLLDDASFGTCARDAAGVWACRPRCVTSLDCCARRRERADAGAPVCEADAAVEANNERCEGATNVRTGACLSARGK